MTKEMMLPKTYFLEGLSCSGKSTALRGLNHTNITVIFKSWPADMPGKPTVDFFLKQDEQKLFRARTASTPVVLVDRGPLSTLTFYSVLEEQKNISAAPVFRWYYMGLRQNTLFQPNGYLFVDVPAAVSTKRSSSSRHIDENNMWLLYPYRIEYWYHKLLRTYEADIPVYRLDGTANPENLVSVLQNRLSSLQETYES